MRRASLSTRNGPFYPFLRPQPRDPLIVIPMIDTAGVFMMHRVEKRMVPCEGDDCVFHRAKCAIEFRCMFPAMCQGGLVGIVDLPGSMGEPLDTIARVENGLFNVKLRISRLKGVENGPVICSMIDRSDWIGEKGGRWSQEYLDETLDRLLAGNLEFARANLAAAKNGDAQISRLTRDLGAI